MRAMAATHRRATARHQSASSTTADGEEWAALGASRSESAKEGSTIMAINEQLVALSTAELQNQVHRRALLPDTAPAPASRARYPCRLVLALLLAGGGFVGWIIALAIRLPARYRADHWNVVWAAALELPLAGAMAWAARRRLRASPSAPYRQMPPPFLAPRSSPSTTVNGRYCLGQQPPGSAEAVKRGWSAAAAIRDLPDGRGDDEPALRSAGLEEGDHREDAAVVVVGLGEAQLGEDTAYVLLDGPLRDPQAAGDAGVGAPLRHQLHHLVLPYAKHRQRIVTAAGGHQLLHQRGVHDRTALGDPLEQAGHALAEQDVVFG